MILIADGGSTKADWIAINKDKKEAFRVRTLGLNPEVNSTKELTDRIIHMFQLINIKEDVEEIYFYGAGCGTPVAIKILQDVLESIFINANVFVAEDMLAAVYAASGKEPAIVCILGTGSNSCYFDGVNLHMKTVSLGYIVMDEASGNHFGKILLKEYFFLSFFSISSEIPIASSLPFLKQLSLTRSPSSIVVFKVLPTLFWLLAIKLEATDKIFCDDR